MELRFLPSHECSVPSRARRLYVVTHRPYRPVLVLVSRGMMVDRLGVPPVRTAGADTSDHCQVVPTVLEFPKVGGAPGRPRALPDEAYADHGFDSEATRASLRWH